MPREPGDSLFRRRVLRRAWLALAFSAAIALGCQSASEPPSSGAPSRHDLGSPAAAEAPSTFSIVARDPATGDLGVAVASKFLAVGVVVPWLDTEGGAIVTQAYANTSWGPRALRMLRDGWSAKDAIDRLFETDREGEFRQIGIVPRVGAPHARTGSRCPYWAGDRTSADACVQGNTIVDEATLDAMLRAYGETRGELAERLLAALEAGENAGGDVRGRQSAALVVVRERGGYGGFDDRYIDLRVDDHPDPVRELRRLLELRLGTDPVSVAGRLEHQASARAAAGVLEDAAAEDPALTNVRFELARILFAMGKTREGLAELDRARSREPNYPHHHFRAARILASARLNSEALAEIRRTVALNPRWATAIRREAENPTSPFHPLREEILRALEAARAPAESR